MTNTHTHTQKPKKKQKTQNIRFEQFLIHSQLPLLSFRDTFVYEK